MKRYRANEGTHKINQKNSLIIGSSDAIAMTSPPAKSPAIIVITEKPPAVELSMSISADRHWAWSNDSAKISDYACGANVLWSRQNHSASIYLHKTPTLGDECDLRRSWRTTRCPSATKRRITDAYLQQLNFDLGMRPSVQQPRVKHSRMGLLSHQLGLRHDESLKSQRSMMIGGFDGLKDRPPLNLEPRWSVSGIMNLDCRAAWR